MRSLGGRGFWATVTSSNTAGPCQRLGPRPGEDARLADLASAAYLQNGVLEAVGKALNQEKEFKTWEAEVDGM